MPKLDRFLIAPYDTESGETTDVKPWLIPDTAFEELLNAYIFRGRVRKRVGSRWLGSSEQSTRLRVKIGTTDGAGNFAGFVPLTGGVPIVTAAIGQLFSISNALYTVTAFFPAQLLKTVATPVATFNNVTGAVVFVGAPALADIYYYPSLPVMGLRTFTNAPANIQPTIAFDTRFAYQYIGAGWERIAAETVPGAASWTGTDVQFFSTTSYFGVDPSVKIFYVTNFNPLEPNFMRTYDGAAWSNFRPPLSGGIFLNSCRVLISWKNRLLAFNTWEGAGLPGNNFTSRVRYSRANFDPTNAAAFLDNAGGSTAFVDAATNEAIVSVAEIRDRLIVYFERSTWELVYQGNQLFPFTWQLINTELGSESTFSIISVDKFAIGIADVGVHSCSGTNVERIDTKIPQAVFNILQSADGPDRVYGIRDYFIEMFYWTFPNTTQSPLFPYPNRILVYNYRNNTWAFNIDSITCFGYFQPLNGVTWDSTTVTWDDPESWDTGDSQTDAIEVIAGNQEGWTFIVDSEETTNAAALQITDAVITPAGSNLIVLTIINHNLIDGDYGFITGITGTGNLTLLNNKTFYIVGDLSNPNTVTIAFDDGLGTIIAGTYSGGGVLARVSNINILTKEYNFYTKDFRNCYVPQVDFMVDATTLGEVTVEYYVSTNSNPMVAASDPLGTNSQVGTNILETFPYPTVPFEAQASRLVHPVSFQADGEFIQLEIFMSNDQMTRIVTNSDGSVDSPAFEDLQIHFMQFYATPTTNRME